MTPKDATLTVRQHKQMHNTVELAYAYKYIAQRAVKSSTTIGLSCLLSGTNVLFGEEIQAGASWLCSNPASPWKENTCIVSS